VNLKTNLRKYFRYVFMTDSLVYRTARGAISEHAFRTAAQIRGAARPPAIIVHGIMKRSGTVYSSELLGLHRDLHPHPNRIWEVPFLAQTGTVNKLQEDFLFDYRENAGRLGDRDFLPIMGAALIAYLYEYVPPGQRLLFKVPGVEHLDAFYDVFPGENLMLVVRDGRDLVSSTIKTWPQLRFSDVCKRWARSARMIRCFDREHAGRGGYLLVRYEDAVREPDRFVMKAIEAFDLDPAGYPTEKIGSLPVIGSSTTRKEGKTWMKKTSGFNPIGRWQSWSPLRKLVFKRLAGQELIDLGYVPDSKW
jgi:hypothetical protein